MVASCASREAGQSRTESGFATLVHRVMHRDGHALGCPSGCGGNGFDVVALSNSSVLQSGRAGSKAVKPDDGRARRTGRAAARCGCQCARNKIGDGEICRAGIRSAMPFADDYLRSSRVRRDINFIDRCRVGDLALLGLWGDIGIEQRPAIVRAENHHANALQSGRDIPATSSA